MYFPLAYRLGSHTIVSDMVDKKVLEYEKGPEYLSHEILRASLMLSTSVLLVTLKHTPSFLYLNI